MGLSTQQQQLVEQRLSNEARSSGISYLLWFFLGPFGAHRFYSGRPGSAVAMLLLFWLGILLAAIVVGWVFLIAYLIWWFIDAFLIPGMVDAHRSALRGKISQEIAVAVDDGTPS